MTGHLHTCSSLQLEMGMLRSLGQVCSMHACTVTAWFPPDKIKGRMCDNMRLSCLVITALCAERDAIVRCSTICFEGGNAGVSSGS